MNQPARIGWWRLGTRSARIRRACKRAVQGIVATLTGALLVVAAFWVVVWVGEFPRALLDPSRTASLQFLDQAGEPIADRVGGHGGRETWVPLAQIPAAVQHAFIASEDHRFYAHHGVDVVGLLRATWLDVRLGRFAYGGSTLTMQLVRAVIPRRRTLRSKITELVFAARLERVATKTQILEQLINRVYFGRGAWGIEAAAQRYFGKAATALSVGEAVFLAVLPRGPSAYNPINHLEQALARRGHLFSLMEKRGYLGAAARELAESTPLTFVDEPPPSRGTHFVEWLRATQRLPLSGVVQTTLDLPLQHAVETAVVAHVNSVQHLGISQAAVIIIRNADGAAMAWVGSRAYAEGAAGAVDGVATLRRPGSTLKPFVYALALERGETPASIALDVILPEERHRTYAQEVKQHGVARYREALAGSYNLAAIHTLQASGPRALAERLARAGITTLGDPAAHTESLAVGEANMRLSELTNSFMVFGTGGVWRPLHAVTTVIEPGATSQRVALAREVPVFAPDMAWLVFDILADADARRPMFGDAAPMELPFPVAIKTGTTRGFTDNFALGTTADFTVGVWAGNFDGAPTAQTMAMQGAAPLLRAAFVALSARFGDPTVPARPTSIEEADVCMLSGQAPGPYCPTKREVFAHGTVPSHVCTWHQRRCGMIVIKYPDAATPWLRATGRLDQMDECTDAPALQVGDVPTASPPVEEPGSDVLRIIYPRAGARYVLDPQVPPTRQRPPLRAAPAQADVTWTINGQPADAWVPRPGRHVARAMWRGQTREVEFTYE